MATHEKAALSYNGLAATHKIIAPTFRMNDSFHLKEKKMWLRYLNFGLDFEQQQKTPTPRIQTLVLCVCLAC